MHIVNPQMLDFNIPFIYSCLYHLILALQIRKERFVLANDTLKMFNFRLILPNHSLHILVLIQD